MMDTALILFGLLLTIAGGLLLSGIVLAALDRQRASHHARRHEDAVRENRSLIARVRAEADAEMEARRLREKDRG